MGAGEYATVKEVYTRACNAERIEEKRLAAKKLKSTPAGSTPVAEKGDTSGSAGYNKGRGGFNKNRNFGNCDSGGNYNKGGSSQHENHPGKDCDGNLVKCNHCGRKGRRAYECFNNPRSRNFRPEMSSRNGAQADKRPRMVHVMNQTEANTKGNVVTGLENSRTCDVDISIPSGVIITCNNLYPDVPIMCGSTTLVADLIAFPLHDFDVILGMDWLSRHKAKIDCEKQKVSVVGPSGVHEFYRGSSLKIISALTLKSYLRKGCPMYLCHVHDTSKEEPRVEDVRIANEFVDVFPDDIPGMPPRRDVEFSVDLMPGTGPISKPPYRMAR
ncbi:uncharacterized protein LOC130589917 [Beta vulgaris subsp. vulgaris]|uniref:uncharacterized protein LOC130589917 n=1 Tax=Beta vulgaris subsp. vulgaris TaxID=3555 RepID=UPI0025479AE8|nr:uncharacterized protein LOC130589917 [Beta vulgaris subsp. vulgaris]